MNTKEIREDVNIAMSILEGRNSGIAMIFSNSETSRKPNSFKEALRADPISELEHEAEQEILRLPVFDEEDVFGPDAYSRFKDQYFLVYDGKDIILVDTQGYNYARYALGFRHGSRAYHTAMKAVARQMSR